MIVAGIALAGLGAFYGVVFTFAWMLWREEERRKKLMRRVDELDGVLSSEQRGEDVVIRRCVPAKDVKELIRDE